MAVFGDGPFGDGPFGDGPFDDGPFDDGPFGDGPFGDGLPDRMVTVSVAFLLSKNATVCKNAFHLTLLGLRRRSCARGSEKTTGKSRESATVCIPTA